MFKPRAASAEEVVYSAEPQLRAPARFASELRADLRVAPGVAWRLFLHALRAGHRQSLMGYAWLLLPPLAMAATWAYLNRVGVVGVGQTETPYPVYVLTGTILWQVFADALQSPTQQLAAARGILTKTRTPHEAPLLAGLFDVLFNFAVRALVLLPVYLWWGAGWGRSVLLAPFGVAALLLLGFAGGLLLAPAGLLYKDVSRGLSLMLGLWFFLTPVVYSPPTRGAAALLVTLNPVAPLLVTTRRWLTSGTPAPERGFAQVFALSLLLFVAGWLYYRLARPHLVARL